MCIMRRMSCTSVPMPYASVAKRRRISPIAKDEAVAALVCEKRKKHTLYKW